MFAVDAVGAPNGYHYLQLHGYGGCLNDWVTDLVHEWDYIRFGSMDGDEQMVATNPGTGFLDPEACGELDRFTMTFDTPHYVYVDDIVVSAFGAEPPLVLQTRRLTSGDPQTVEIVLDRPLPTDARKRFEITGRRTEHTLSFTFVHGDANADGTIDLADMAVMQSCYGGSVDAGTCAAFDFDGDADIDLNDYASFEANLTGAESRRLSEPGRR